MTFHYLKLPTNQWDYLTNIWDLPKGIRALTVVLAMSADRPSPSPIEVSGVVDYCVANWKAQHMAFLQRRCVPVGETTYMHEITVYWWSNARTHTLSRTARIDDEIN